MSIISFQNVETDLDFYYYENTMYKTQNIFPTLPQKTNRAYGFEPFFKVFDYHLYMLFKAVLLCLIAKMIKFIYFPRKFQSHITKMLEVNQKLISSLLFFIF